MIRTQISLRDSISVSASASSSIIGMSMMFSGGLDRVMRATGASSSRVMREYFVTGCVAIVIRGRGRPRHTVLSGPESMLVILADCFQLFVCRHGRLGYVNTSAQCPAGVLNHILDFDSGMHGSEIGFAVFAETQYRFGRDRGGRPTTRQANPFTPAATVSVTWAGDVRDTFGQALLAVLQQDNKSMGERGDVTCSAGTRQASYAFCTPYLGGVEIAEAINLGGA